MMIVAVLIWSWLIWTTELPAASNTEPEMLAVPQVLLALRVSRQVANRADDQIGLSNTANKVNQTDEGNEKVVSNENNQPHEVDGADTNTAAASSPEEQNKNLDRQEVPDASASNETAANENGLLVQDQERDSNNAAGPTKTLNQVEEIGTALGRAGQAARSFDELKKAIAEHKSAIGDDTNLSETVRTSRLKLISAANETILKITELESQRLALENQIKALSEESEEKWRQRLNAVRPADMPLIDESITSSKLAIDLEKKRRELEREKQKLAGLESSIRHRADRVTQIPIDRAQIVQRRSQLEEEIAQSTTMADAEGQLNLILLELKRQEASVELRKLEREVERQTLGGKIEPIQRDLAARDVQRLQDEIANWERVAKKLRHDEVKAAEKLARDAADTAPIRLKRLAERNSELIDERQKVADNLQRLRAEQQSVNELVESIVRRRQEIKKKIDTTGLTATSGMLLVELRRKLATTGESHIRVRQLQDELQNLNLKTFGLNEERDALADPAATAGQVVDTSDSKLRERALQFVETKRDYLDQLLEDYQVVTQKTSEVCQARKKLIDEINSTLAFIDQNALWIRSTEPIGWLDLAKTKQGIDQMLSFAYWTSILQASHYRMIRRPYESAAAGCLLLLLVGVYLRTHRLLQLNPLRRLESSELPPGTGRTPEPFGPLFYALSSTLAASAILPCGLLYFAWLQEPPFDKQTLSGALAYNLTFTLVPLLFSLSVINRALAPHGLAERYLRWPPGICQAVLTTSRGLNWFGLPLIWLYSILDTFNAGVWNDSLGRLAYIAVMGIVMMGLRGTYKQVRDYCRTCSGSCTETDLGIWARGMLAVGGYGPLALIFLSVAGYHFTAVQLGWRLYWMLIITAGIALLAGIAGRVLTIMHDGFRGHADRSLALSAAHQTSAPEETRDQVHRILRVFAWVSFVIIAWQLWSDVIPAFNYLENVRLWESLAKYGTLQPVTLRDVLWSVGIMVITLILSKHLPGLLEIVLLERLPLDRGGRYAISFICRYLIVFTGLLVVFRWIGLSWTSVQWLAAGLTVGLGFGLQEIFANLVSGLIILIERPVRVGDFVTVNGVSGHVCRVQLRATTIKDPDHRELIVPNKRFITEDVMNWTLTDRSTRVTIRVGVAYGSDTKKVQRVLHEVARANPLVKAVPGPEVVFLAFGESTLDFELRVMVATRDDYFQVTHELNMAVDAAFRKEQINIAFPQRDVHLHGLPVALSVQPIEEQSTTAITVDALGETTAGASKRAA